MFTVLCVEIHVQLWDGCGNMIAQRGCVQQFCWFKSQPHVG